MNTANPLNILATEASKYLPATIMSAPSPASNDGLPQDVAFSPGRIPKKDSLPNPIPRVSGEFDDGGLVLPPGVTLPPSVTPQVLAGKPKRFLLELPPAAMVEALAEFDQAVQERGSEIRSLPAYLIGVIKRYKTIQQANKGGGGQLSLRVLDRLDRLVSTGYCTQAEIDEKLKNKLMMLSEDDALGAIDEMNAIQRSEIRQFAGYFMGIMNRYAKKRDNIQNNHQGNNAQRGRDQNQDYRERFSHYGRGSDDQNNMGKYGRDSGSGRDRDERRRSRSRSRSYDRDRERRRGRRHSRSRSDSRSRSRSRERRRRRRRYSDSRSRSRSSSRDRNSRSHRSRREHDRQSSRNTSHPKLGGFSVPPPPPPRPGMNIPPPNNQQRSVNDQQLQQLFQMPQQPTRPPQQSQQISLPTNLSQQQIQALQHILQGPNGQQPNALAPQNNSRWASGQAMAHIPAQGQPWQQRPPQGPPGQAWPPLDIMGLADKAAQVLSGQQFMSHQNASANPNAPSLTEAELPPLCKLAIQNLRGSGHINQEPLDSYVCSLLKKLPEANALVSLETFASCDVSKMRNKTAYLSGILKKELVKLGIP